MWSSLNRVLKFACVWQMHMTAYIPKCMTLRSITTDCTSATGPPTQTPPPPHPHFINLNHMPMYCLPRLCTVYYSSILQMAAQGACMSDRTEAHFLFWLKLEPQQLKWPLSTWTTVYMHILYSACLVFLFYQFHIVNQVSLILTARPLPAGQHRSSWFRG